MLTHQWTFLFAMDLVENRYDSAAIANERKGYYFHEAHAAFVAGCALKTGGTLNTAFAFDLIA